MCRAHRLVVLFSLVAGLVNLVSPAPAQDTPVDRDELLLRQAGIRTDTDNLRNSLRPRPAVGADAQRIESLVRQLGNDDFQEREAASRELMGCGRAALPALHRALASSDPEVVTRAQNCIRDIEARTNPEYLAAAVRLLARRRPPEIVKVLLETLGHPEATARKWAYDSLVQLAGPDDYADVLQAIKDTRPYVRAGAIGLSYKYKGKPEELAPLLREGLRDDNSLIRRSAAWSLAANAIEEEVVPVLAEVLKDKEDEAPLSELNVAGKAVLRLAGLKERARPALPAMLEMSKSGTRRNRPVATLALGYLTRNEKSFVPDVVPFLVQLLEDNNQPIGNRVQAVGALGVIGPDAKAAVPALRHALTEEDLEDPKGGGELHGTILGALGQIGLEAESAVPDLVAHFQDPQKDPRLRKLAAEALGKIGPTAKAAIPALAEALKETVLHDEVREAAARALTKIHK